MRRCRAYSGLDGEHFVSGGKALQPALLMGLPGWPSHTYNKPVTPDIIVRTAGPDWSVRSRAGPATLVGTGDVAAGANAVIGHLIDGVLARRPKLIGLHAAGTQIGDGAVLFTGDSGAGKSSLVLHLARRGYRCLADDQILVDLAGPPQVVALGLALKARLPLPPGDALARFVTARVASADDASAYLHLRREEAAPFATGLPLTAIIVVRRGLGQAATAGGGGGDMAPLSPGGAPWRASWSRRRRRAKARPN